MYLIGELINSTRKRIARAVGAGDAATIREIALRQVEAGASSLDINGGVPGRESECLPWLVDVVQDVVDAPLCLDSADPVALARALPRCRRQPMINSITLDPARLETLVPLAKEYGAGVIALCLDESGYPTTSEDRVAIGGRLIEKLGSEGIPRENIYVDPAIFPVSTDTRAGQAALDAIAALLQAYPGVHAVCGLSNVSFGLPERALLNQTFLVLAMARGLDAVIADPCDPQLMANLIAAETLLNRDADCLCYLQAHQDNRLAPARKEAFRAA